MVMYNFTITSVMDIEKPTTKGYNPNVHFVKFRNLDLIEYKGSSPEFRDYIFNCVGRHYDNTNGGYYSLGMVIPPEVMRSFEEAIEPQMLKCRLHVTNAMEKLNGQLVPATQFKFTVIDTISVYNKEEKDMRKNDATVGDVYNGMSFWQKEVCQYMIAEVLHRKRTAQESAVCIRDQMLVSGATHWELETFDRFVRKYIADKEEK